MNTKIYNTISDPMYTRQLIEGYENDDLPQWLLYIWKWSEKYYDAKHVIYEDSDIIWINDYLEYSKELLNQNGNKKIAFISLGCGNSNTEYHLLNTLNINKNIKYIGVDTSYEMLNMSMEKFENSKLDYCFLRADIWSKEFRYEIVFLPEYKLKLLEIYRHDVDGIINLFEGYSFSLLKKQIKGQHAQLVFKKNH